MKEELLAFKYKSIKLERQYNEKSIVSLGWKCRKYINWDAVHVGDDRTILREFGDYAVDHQLVVSYLLPRVNAIMLNAQRWRLDKENWSIEPERESSWKYAAELLSTANENPGVVVSYLSELIGDLEKIKNIDLVEIFQRIVLFNVVKGKLNVDINDYSPLFVPCPIYQIFENLVGAESAIKELCALRDLDDIESAMNAFGLPSLDRNHDYSAYTFDTSIQKQKFAITFSEMPLTTLYSYSDNLNSKVICLNSNHLLIKKLVANEDLMQIFLRYFEASIKTEQDNPLLASQLKDYNLYFSLTLNRYFQ